MATYEKQESSFLLNDHLEKYKENQTMVIDILLLGFQGLHIFKVPFLSMLLLIYCVTIVGNILIIVLISTNQSLHSPMYFFLQHLSISDILLTTNIVPNMIHVVIHDGATMSLSGCISQYNFFGGSEAFECFLLTVMSYDRYLAICNPLHYSSIMDHQFCVTLVVICWLLGFTFTTTSVITIGLLNFCGQNIIDHFFCDLAPLLELSCSDTFLVRIEVFIFSIPIIILPFLSIIVSYVCIALAITKIKSNIGRQKAFSTCSSHLAVVGMFYGTLAVIYVVPDRGQSPIINKLLSLLYTVVTPLLNPVIYSMRSEEMKKAFGKCINEWNSEQRTRKT